MLQRQLLWMPPTTRSRVQAAAAVVAAEQRACLPERRKRAQPGGKHWSRGDKCSKRLPTSTKLSDVFRTAFIEPRVGSGREQLWLYHKRGYTMPTDAAAFQLGAVPPLPALRRWSSNDRKQLARFLRQHCRFLYEDSRVEPRWIEQVDGVGVVARRLLNPGDVIHELSGTWTRVNAALVEKLAALGLDHSLMERGCDLNRVTMLLTGSLSLVNHSCDANCELDEANGWVPRVCERIEPGQQLTLFYGANFLGKNNADCRGACCSID